MDNVDLTQCEQSFRMYMEQQFAEGSNAAPSYITGMKRLDKILKEKTNLLNQDESIWEVSNAEFLEHIYQVIIEEQEKGRCGKGIFAGTESPSYYMRNFYSAAIRKYAEYQFVYLRRVKMLSMFTFAEDANNLSIQLSDMPIIATNLLWEDHVEVKSELGKERLISIKKRENEYIFREMVLKNYNYRCCLTGLPLTDSLIASYIVSPRSNKAIKMNPENGLCLAATYALAFDNHLISFDNSYRLLLSPKLKQHYADQAFINQFVQFSGRKIDLPSTFMPSQQYLAKHREIMSKVS